MIKIAQKKGIHCYAHQMWILIVLALLIGGIIGYCIPSLTKNSHISVGESIKGSQTRRLAEFYDYPATIPSQDTPICVLVGNSDCQRDGKTCNSECKCLSDYGDELTGCYEGTIIS